MKKLAIFSFHTSPLSRLGVMDAGGMNVYILSLSKALVKKGWQVDIYTRSLSGYAVVIPASLNVRVIHIPVSAADVLTKQQLVSYTDIFADGVVQFMKRYSLHYDILHAHYYLSGLAALKVTQTIQLPVVQTFHTLGVMKELYGGKKEIERIAKEDRIVKNVDQMVVATELEKQVLMKYHQADASHVAVIAPGVDHRLFRPASKKQARETIGFPFDRKLVVYVGRIDPIKGITTLIESIGIVNIVHPQFHEQVSVFIIGGDIEKEAFWQIPEVKDVQRLIRRHHLDCCVEFLGAKPHAQLAAYYAAADIVAIPSLYESFSLVALEAMACGACVLAARVGGPQLLITEGQNGMLFESGDVDNLNNTLYTLLQDESQQKRLGKNAHQFSLGFSWDTMADNLEKVYNQIV